jgi:hemolysin activation/secretion protein
MGFWRSLANYIDRKLDESNERAAAERAERNRRRSIQQDGRDYGKGYQQGIDEAKAERPRPWENRRPASSFDSSPWDVNVNTDFWTPNGGGTRKKKRRSDNYW